MDEGDGAGVWFSPSVVSDCDTTDCGLPSSAAHGLSHGKNTGVGCHFLLQGKIFTTQGSNPGLLKCRPSPALQADSLQTEPPGEDGGGGTLTALILANKNNLAVGGGGSGRVQIKD